MKKKLICILAATMTLSLAACGSSSNSLDDIEKTESTDNTNAISPLSSTSEVTEDYLETAMKSDEIMKTCKTFRMKRTYADPGDELYNGMTEDNIISSAKGIFEMSTHIVYSDGYISDTYFSDDPQDLNYYMASTAGNDVSQLEDGFADEYSSQSVAGYAAGDISVNQVKEENGEYIAEVTVSSDGEEVSKDTVTLDPATGFITKIISTYPSVKGSGDSSCTMEFDYSDGLTVDYTAKTENGAQETEDTTVASSENGGFNLNAEDINGNPVTSEDIKDAKLILLNYWEPWCGPCVKEMPALQKLYENYKDKGLVVLGVYSSFENQADAEAIVDSNGITYPILKTNDELDKLAQDYYPATYFIDGQGNLLTEEPYAGARSYEEWESIVKDLLK